MVLVRVYGHKTDLLIDRKQEIKNIRVKIVGQSNYNFYLISVNS